MLFWDICDWFNLDQIDNIFNFFLLSKHFPPLSPPSDASNFSLLTANIKKSWKFLKFTILFRPFQNFMFGLLVSNGIRLSRIQNYYVRWLNGAVPRLMGLVLRRGPDRLVPEVFYPGSEGVAGGILITRTK